MDASDDAADLMWMIYESYAVEMQLEDAFEATEILSGGALLPIPDPQMLVRLQRPLGPYTVVCIESGPRADAFELLFDAVLTRDWAGVTTTNLTTIDAGWRRRR